MDAIPEVATKRITVGAFKGEAVSPQSFLASAQIFNPIAAMRTHQGHKPRGIPANCLTRILDQLFQILPIDRAAQ